jgi:hypothetical protein
MDDQHFVGWGVFSYIAAKMLRILAFCTNFLQNLLFFEDKLNNFVFFDENECSPKEQLFSSKVSAHPIRERERERESYVCVCVLNSLFS